MKILLVSMTPSHPVTSGNRKWILAQSQYLEEKGNNVYFLYVSCPVLFKHNCESDIISIMEKRWKDHLLVYKAGILSRVKISLSYKLRKLLFRGYHTADDLCPISLPSYIKQLNSHYKFDACIVNYYWLTKVLIGLPVSRRALNTHDSFSYKDFLGGKYAWMSTTPNEEAKALQRCNFVFALQKTESYFFQHLSPNSKILDVYCFLKSQSNPIVDNHNILFLSGDNDYNINGLKWFIMEVFPNLVSEYGDAQLVVGGAISKTAELMNCNNMKIIGLIDNPDKFFSLGDVCINPTYQGTGLKIKTFESIAYNKVTITRMHSTEGIFEPENAPILSSDSPEEWILFFRKVWNSKPYIADCKSRDIQYIEKLNKYIDGQYDIFLNQ